MKKLSIGIAATALLVCIGPAVAQTQGPAMNNNMGNIYGNQGIITQGQTGNNTINLGPAPPTWAVKKDNSAVSNADGTFTRTKLIETLSAVALSNVVFMVRGKTVVDISVNGVGSGPAMIIGPGTTIDGWRWFAFTMPTVGEFNVGAKTTDRDTPYETNVLFNAKLP